MAKMNFFNKWVLIKSGKKSTKYQFFFHANASWTKWLFINLLTPKSDQHLISPHKITTESNIKVMRIKEMIIN